MHARKFLKALFQGRPDAPWVGYIPVVLVLAIFTLMGLEDGGLVGVLHFIALLVIAVLQLRYRTLAGWMLLLGMCLWYGVEVALSTDQVHDQYGEYVFFMACGFLPALALIVWRPRLTTRRNY